MLGVVAAACGADTAGPTLDAQAGLSSDASSVIALHDAGHLAGADASAADASASPPDGGASDARALDAKIDAPGDSGPAVDAMSGGGSMLEAGASDGGPASEAGADDDRCQVAILDPQNPPTTLPVTGNLGTHDPALIEQDGKFYLWHTGRGLPGKTSPDLTAWQAAPAAFPSGNPAWIAKEVPSATDLWAPDVSHFNGQYHLYYAASKFSSNSSCIGHATRDSLATGAWNDQGSVICSNHGSQDNFNAIDPNVIVDQAGTPWLVFGSFWDGIKAVELDAKGARKGTEIHSLASRGGGAIEAPFVVRRCGYYYLFVSFDKCCAGVDSTYNIRVGRSKELLGPYLDRDGQKMLDGGGTLVLKSQGRYHGPGHNAVIFTGDRAYNVYHAYDANNNGASMLRVSELAWDADGWPISGGP